MKRYIRPFVYFSLFFLLFLLSSIGVYIQIQLAQEEDMRIPIQRSTSKEMSDKEIRQIEKAIVKLFSEANEVTFVFKPQSPNPAVCVVSDKRVLSEFAKHFRLNPPITYTRIPNNVATMSAVFVQVVFDSKTTYNFRAGNPNFRYLEFIRVNRDSWDLCKTKPSVDFELFFNYYFSEVIGQVFMHRGKLQALPLDHYREDGYGRSFLENIEKTVSPYPYRKPLE